MFKNKRLVLLFVVILTFVGLYVAKNRIGDIRPAILPSSPINKQQNANITTPTDNNPGDPVNFPLKLPSGFKIGVFAKNLGNARDLAFSPGNVLLLSIPAAGKIVALPDKNNDGRSDEVKDILTRLDRPHGIAFYDGKLYVAEENRVSFYDWSESNLQASNGTELFKLPNGGRHTTRSLAFDREGDLFVSIGSTCDVCVEKNAWLGAVIARWPDGRIVKFATGLRNAVFITVNPNTNELWGTEMGRDFLGDNLPPDEINIIRETGNYGWPFCYGHNVKDNKFTEPTNIRCGVNTEAPIYEIPAHSAPLGLAFIDSPQFPNDWQGDLLVSYHGSWNSSVPVGYKVVRLNVEGNRVTEQEDFLTGFIQGSDAPGRPVDLAFDSQGSLYISDDKSGTIYKVISIK